MLLSNFVMIHVTRFSPRPEVKFNLMTFPQTFYFATPSFNIWMHLTMITRKTRTEERQRLRFSLIEIADGRGTIIWSGQRLQIKIAHRSSTINVKTQHDAVRAGKYQAEFEHSVVDESGTSFVNYSYRTLPLFWPEVQLCTISLQSEPMQ